jgi:hypothetical protein
MSVEDTRIKVQKFFTAYFKVPYWYSLGDQRKPQNMNKNSQIFG